MESDSVPSQAQQQQEQTMMFAIGQKAEETKDQPDANATRGDLQAGKRMEAFGIKQREQKRDREPHNVNLRKQKRDEVLKRRREQASSNPNSQGLDASGTAGGMNSVTLPDNMDISVLTIEEALNYQKQSGMECEAFITGVATKMKFAINDFSQLNQLIYVDDIVTKLFACVGMRKLLSIENNPPIQAVIDANLVPVFIQLLHHNIPKFQFEAAWCLTNIASGTTDHVNNLIEKDVLSNFIQLLASVHVEVVEQVIWGIGNIAGDSSTTRDSVLHSGALDKIAAVLDKAPVGSSFLRNASWALSNLCRGRPQPDYTLVRRAIPTLIKVLVENDKEEIITDICWALSYLSDGAKDRIQDLLDSRLLTKMIILLNHQNVAIAIPSLRTIGNIVTGDDNQTQVAIEAGLIPALNQIISHQKKSVRKESCWVLSNITAGSQEQVQACLDSGIIDKLITVLMNDDMQVKNEAVWALSNCTASANPVQFGALVEKGLIKALGNVLKVNDVRMLAVALEGLDNTLANGQNHHMDENNENKFALIMEQEGLIDCLEELQQHPNHTIYKQALKIIDKYFQEEYDDPLIQAINNTMSNQQNNTSNNEPSTSGGGLFDL